VKPASEEPLILPVATAEQRAAWQDYDILILTPCADYRSPAKFMQCVVNMVACSWLNGLRIYQMGTTQRMVVDWARNALGRIAVDKINEYTGRPFTHLLWLDDDHVFNPDMAIRLAMNGDLDMISALYFNRIAPHWPVVYVQDYTSRYNHYHMHVLPKAVVQVDAVGFGAMLMRRDVLARVPEPWFTICPEYGEDIGFCTHARQHGVKIFCDGGLTIGHLGEPPTVVEADWLKQISEYQNDMTPLELATRHQPIEQHTPGEAPAIWKPVTEVQ
jgi:hypothetical protein